MSLISIIMMLFAGGGAGNDLLDFVPSKAYWDAAKVEMTVEALTEQLVAPEGGPKGADSVRRQMALRALGELKDAKALPAVETYLKSPDPFLEDYAKAAVAAIKGEPYQRQRVSKDDLRTDLSCLPSGLGAIGGLSVEPGGAMDIAGQLKELAMPGMPDADEIETQIVTGLSEVTSMLGNIRVSALTFGVAGDVGDEKGFVVVLVRGLYDSSALGEMVGGRIGAVRKKAGGLTYHELESDHVYVAPVSDELLVFAAGASRDQIPLAEVGGKITGGGGDFAIGKDLAVMLDKADRAAPLWALATVTESYKQAPFLAPFDTLALGSKALEGDRSRMTLKANGSDPEGAAEVVAQMQKGLDEVREGAAEAAGGGQVPKSIVDMLASMKIGVEGGNATMSADVSSGGALGMLPMMMFSAAPRAEAVEVGAAELKAVEEAPAPAEEKAVE